MNAKHPTEVRGAVSQAPLPCVDDDISVLCQQQRGLSLSKQGSDAYAAMAIEMTKTKDTRSRKWDQPPEVYRSS